MQDREALSKDYACEPRKGNAQGPPEQAAMLRDLRLEELTSSWKPTKVTSDCPVPAISELITMK
jgi:hypothetical protein